MFKCVNTNDTVLRLLCNMPTSITYQNLDYACRQFDCNRSNLMSCKFNQMKIDKTAEQKAFQLKELKDSMVPGFSKEELNEMIHYVATFLLI